MSRWLIQWQFRVELRKKRPEGRRYCNISEACSRAIGVRIEGKSCSHSIERELSMRAEEKWQMALRPGARVIKEDRRNCRNRHGVKGDSLCGGRYICF